MKDKEKHILAITQDLSDCLEYDIEDSSVVDTYDTAYKLANKGWVKLPEDSVVLSREVFELLTDIKNLQQQVQDSLSNTSEDFERIAKQARKETAEKILNEMVNIIKTQSVNDYNFDDKVIEEPILLEKLKEIATREGVEIKE